MTEQEPPDGQTETIAKLVTALVKARSEMGKARKNAKNPHLKSRYADLESVLDAADEALSNNGIAPVQIPVPSSSGVALKTKLAHVSGEAIWGTMTIPADRGGAQGYGSALTYARRYSLASMLGIVQSDDDGHAATQGPRPEDLAAAKRKKEDRAKMLKALDNARQIVSETADENAAQKEALAIAPRTARAKDMIDAWIAGLVGGAASLSDDEAELFKRAGDLLRAEGVIE